MKYADLEPGRVIEAGPYEVTEDEILRFAAAYDTQWFHTDLAAAQEGPFQGLIASGMHTCAMAMRLVSDTILAGSEALASPGLRQVKWPHPVRPGDRLRLRAEILNPRTSRSNASRGVIDYRRLLLNQEGTMVLDLEATAIFLLGERAGEP